MIVLNVQTLLSRHMGSAKAPLVLQCPECLNTEARPDLWFTLRYAGLHTECCDCGAESYIPPFLELAAEEASRSISVSVEPCAGRPGVYQFLWASSGAL